jgi:hypothetical protein
MQKSLELMNIQLHKVVSDINGVTGMTILRAIVAGERDPARLSLHRHKICKHSQETYRATISPSISSRSNNHWPVTIFSSNRLPSATRACRNALLPYKTESRRRLLQTRLRGLRRRKPSVPRSGRDRARTLPSSICAAN